MDVAPGAASVAFTVVDVVWNAVPFHHCSVVLLRIPTLTLATDTSSVALPVNVMGEVVSTWPFVGAETVPLGAATSGVPGAYENGTNGLVGSTLAAASTAVTWSAYEPAPGGAHENDHAVADVPGAVSVDSNWTMVACHAVPFHHSCVAVSRIATRTFVTDRSSVALPENTIGDAENDCPLAGTLTVASGVWVSTGGGEQAEAQ